MEELLKLLHLPIHTKPWQLVTGSTGGLQVGAESLAVSLQAVVRQICSSYSPCVNS